MAGAGFKTFNTGDVLTASDVNTYLMQQTVMVFASSAARTAALGANVAEGMISYLKDTNAVEVYDGSNWVSSDDPNAIQNTIVDAKGDIITATAADTPARLAVGSNGQTLVADSSTSTGLAYAGNQAAGKNYAINGGMDIWQRGTSIALSNSTAYTADRWQGRTGTGNQTVSRQTTSDTTNLPNIQYCARVGRNSGNTGTGIILFEQSIETANSIPLAGKTVVLSFYARKGANFSGASDVLSVAVATGTGTDQNISGYTGGANAFTGSATLTTTWQRFIYSGSFASNITECGIQFNYTPSGTAGAADYFEITGIQLELGSSATPFTRAGGTIQGELAACQRYFEVLANGADATNEMIANLQSYSTTQAFGNLNYKVTKRGSVTITFSSNTDFRVRNTTAGTVATTTMAAGTATPRQAVVTATVASGLTAGSATMIEMNSATGYIWAASEL